MGIVIEKTNNFNEAMLALPFIVSIDKYYPDIKHWYINTVVPGICLNDDNLLLAKENNKIIGIALSKSGIENKLRCIRVCKDYENSGLGIKLIDKTLDLIGPKPLVSVSEELLHSYSRMFVNRYSFSLSEVTKHKYRKNKLEYFFNL